MIQFRRNDTMQMIDHEISEARSLTDAALFLQEEHEPSQAQRVRRCTVTILYVIMEKLARVDRALPALQK
jgi:ABC-type nitrate/sulfonate/bicarbonate transport system ATPase subunit